MWCLFEATLGGIVCVDDLAKIDTFGEERTTGIWMIR